MCRWLVNLIDWRQRATRRRRAWIVRWALWLGLSVATVAGSITWALEALSASVPNRHAEHVEWVLRNEVLQAEVSELTDQLRGHRQVALELEVAREALKIRALRLTETLADLPLRLLSVQDRPEGLTLKVQVAGLQVLRTSPRWQTLRPLSIVATDGGLVVELQIDG